MPGNFIYTRLVLQASKKNFLRTWCALFVCILFFSIPVFTQRAKLDSLKRILPVLKDSQQADCLNLLSLAYSYLNADTAKSYSQKAYALSATIHYLRGKAMALSNDARIAGHSRHDFLLQEKISRQVVELLKDKTEEKILSEAYLNLALALFCQSYFDQSANACKTAIQLAQQTSDNKTRGEAIGMMGSINFESGNYAESFENFNEALGIFKGIHDTYNTAIILSKIGDLYRLAGDKKTALNFYNQSLQYPKSSSLQWHPLVDLGDTYYSLEPYDSAQYDEEKYLQAIKSLTIRTDYSVIPGIRRAEMLIASGDYDEALTLLAEDLKLAGPGGNKNQLMRLLLDLGRAFEGKKDYKNAFAYTRALLSHARSYEAKQYIRDGCKLMFMLYDQLHRVDSAFAYYRLYTKMKDSVSLDEFGKKLAIYKAAAETKKKQTEIELLNSKNLNNEQQLKISEQQLRSESLLKNLLVTGVLVLLLLGFIIFRNIMLKQKNAASRHEMIQKELILQKLESEKTKTELQQQATDLEMQALRAQMNPHFIFNSLNSINRFILQNNKASASKYLTKFSRLVRSILQNSQSSLIPLENELEALQLYLELESVRFNHHFNFTVTIAAGVDVSVLKVPPLMIQPYAENAIWHGLMHKEEKGNLQIEIYTEVDMLCCRIADDGVGRKKAAELRSKSASAHKSMGMEITASRIAMLQKENLPHVQIKITDLTLPDGTVGGTEVILKIPAFYA